MALAGARRKDHERVAAGPKKYRVRGHGRGDNAQGRKLKRRGAPDLAAAGQRKERCYRVGNPSVLGKGEADGGREHEKA